MQPGAATCDMMPPMRSSTRAGFIFSPGLGLSRVFDYLNGSSATGSLMTSLTRFEAASAGSSQPDTSQCLSHLGHGGGGHTSWHCRGCDTVVYGATICQA